jgi:hypothetical protein
MTSGQSFERSDIMFNLTQPSIDTIDAADKNFIFPFVFRPLLRLDGVIRIQNLDDFVQ